MTTLMETSEILIKDGNGIEKKYILSKFPAVQGREITAKYHLGNMPKIGDYKVSEEIMYKLMAFVAVELPSGPQVLNTRDLVNNHVNDWEALAKIEWAMIQKNCSFFRNGQILTFLQDMARKKQPWILKTWTTFLGLLSQAVKPPSTN